MDSEASWGVSKTRGCARSGLSTGSGSTSKTSSAAPAIWPASRAASNAVSSTTGPRLVFTSKRSGLALASRSALTRCRVGPVQWDVDAKVLRCGNDFVRSGQRDPCRCHNSRERVVGYHPTAKGHAEACHSSADATEPQHAEGVPAQPLVGRSWVSPTSGTHPLVVADRLLWPRQAIAPSCARPRFQCHSAAHWRPLHQAGSRPPRRSGRTLYPTSLPTGTRGASRVRRGQRCGVHSSQSTSASAARSMSSRPSAHRAITRSTPIVCQRFALVVVG